MSYSHRASLGISALEVRQRTVALADPAVRQMAQDAVDQGNTAFRAGDYDTAIRRYTDAWAIYPAPNLLPMIGVVMMRQGRFREASYRFSRYLRENPSGDQRGLAQEQLANAQAAMERGGPAQPTVDMDFVAEGYVAPDPATQVPPQVMAQARQTIQVPQQAQQRAPAPTTIPNPYTRRTTIGIWVATGTAVVGLVGLGLWLRHRAE